MYRDIVTRVKGSITRKIPRMMPGKEDVLNTCQLATKWWLSQ